MYKGDFKLHIRMTGHKNENIATLVPSQITKLKAKPRRKQSKLRKGLFTNILLYSVGWGFLAVILLLCLWQFVGSGHVGDF